MSESIDHFGKYLQEINKYPIYSRDEEEKLARQITEGSEEAIQKLVQANLRFVVVVAKKYKGSGMPLSDLVNEGTIGLIEAAKRFNPDRGVKFITYAVWWVRQAILYAIANKSGIVRLPPKQANLLHMMNKKIQSMSQELGREPTLTEIADTIEISEEEIENLLRVSRTSLSVGNAGDENETDGRQIDIEDAHSESADEQIIKDAFVDDVELLLACLNDREKEILKLHYGFKGDTLTLQQIGDKYGLTRERIRQIEKRAINKLKRVATKKNLKEYLD